MKLELDHSSSVPLYVQAEELLRSIISLPEYKDGKLLPNEVDLAKQLGISRSTLRQSINKLVMEGKLSRKKGVGTSVIDSLVSSKARNWLSFSQEMKANGLVIRNFELHICWECPDEPVRNFFQLEANEKILKLVRLRGTKDGPFVYFISYFSPKIGLTGDEDFSQPLYELLERNYNIVAKLSKEEVSAMVSDKFLGGKLDIAVGSPILKRKRFVYDPGGRPIEFNLGYYRADSFVYRVESEREI